MATTGGMQTAHTGDEPAATAAHQTAAPEARGLRSLPHLVSRSWFWARSITHHPANRRAAAAALARATRWHLKAHRDPGTTALVTVDGRTRLLVRPHQFSAVWTLYDGIHDWEELQFCFQYLRAGDHMVDVGANVGVVSSLVGTRVPGVRITAIEPFPPVCDELRRNLALNRLDVTVVEGAVGPAPGEARFEVLERDVLNRLAAGDGPDEGTITVPVRTLDDVIAERPPALVKIDVEGYELNVLRGATRLLGADDGPVLLMEHCGHSRAFGIEPGEVRAFLADHGYRLHLLDGAFTPWDSDALPPTLNVLAARDIDAVRRRLDPAAPGVARPPVRVSVRYEPEEAQPTAGADDGIAASPGSFRG